MTDSQNDLSSGAPDVEPDVAPEVAHGELVDHPVSEAVEPVEAEERREAVEEPAKVMRIGSMIKQLLDEVRQADLDGPARERLKAIYDSSIQEVGAALSPDLRAELERVAWMPWNRPSSHPTSWAWAMRSSASLGSLPSPNGMATRSSSARRSGDRAAPTSWIELS